MDTASFHYCYLTLESFLCYRWLISSAVKFWQTFQIPHFQGSDQKFAGLSESTCFTLRKSSSTRSFCTSGTWTSLLLVTDISCPPTDFINNTLTIWLFVELSYHHMFANYNCMYGDESHRLDNDVMHCHPLDRGRITHTSFIGTHVIRQNDGRPSDFSIKTTAP